MIRRQVGTRPTNQEIAAFVENPMSGGTWRCDACGKDNHRLCSMCEFCYRPDHAPLTLLLDRIERRYLTPTEQRLMDAALRRSVRIRT